MAENLSARLTEYRHYRSAVAGCRIGCRWLALNLLLLTSAGVLDNLAGLPVAARLTIVGIILAVNLWQAWIARREYRLAQISDREAAVALEKLGGVHDNALINAVCFLESNEVQPALLQQFVEEAAKAGAAIKVPEWKREPVCRRYLKLLLLSVLASGIYLAGYGPYAVNALLRYGNPWGQLASLNFAQFTVRPGDVAIVEGDDLMITASAVRNGVRINNLKILLTGGSTPLLLPMEARDGDSAYTLKAVRQTLHYAIRSDDGDGSRDFTVTVTPKPAFKDISLQVVAPPYTGLMPKLYRDAPTAVSLPQGGTLIITARPPEGCVSQFFWNDDSLDTVKLAGLTVEKDGVLSATLRDAAGRIFRDVWLCAVKAVPDRPPTVRFLNREQNIEAGNGQTVELFLQAEDDYGIGELTVSAASDGTDKVIKDYHYDASPVKNLRETVALKLDRNLFPPGSTVRLTAKVTDRHTPPQSGVTDPPILLQVIDLAARVREQVRGTPDGQLFELLYRTLEMQQNTRNWLSGAIRNMKRWEYVRLKDDQRSIAGTLQQALDAARKQAQKGRLRKIFLQALTQLTTRDAVELRTSAEAILQAWNRTQPRDLNAIIDRQTLLINRLQSLLAGMAAARIEQEKQRKETAEDQNEKQLFDRLQQLKNKLDEFNKEQRKIIEQTEAIDPKKAEDWAEKEEKLMGNLAASETEWAKLFKAAFSDLSKKQNQDFSNSTMAEELVRLYEELQKAGAALEKKKVEIATVAEANAANFAQSTSANLERWLADNKDNIKWVSEENGKLADTGMSDLPAEINDIIGDLIEKEDDMGEDTKDSTNSFTWDNDDFLGWGVADGTIDSMQAKGITGNVLPNNNEVGGRSGEGRSGRSSGQYVQQDAVGKGEGRKTPTRLTQSPFEKGTVEDKSKDASTGSTGGGKQSGVGDEGLTGVTPDQDSDIAQRLGGNQSELKQKAQALLRRLNEKGLPSGEVQEALRKIAAYEQVVKQGEGVAAKRLKGEIVGALKNARGALEQTLKADYEKVSRQKLQDFRSRHQEQEKIPAGYEDTVGLYFKSLSEGGNE